MSTTAIHRHGRIKAISSQNTNRSVLFFAAWHLTCHAFALGAASHFVAAFTISTTAGLAMQLAICNAHKNQSSKDLVYEHRRETKSVLKALASPHTLSHITGQGYESKGQCSI
jgi:hypothetical protein